MLFICCLYAGVDLEGELLPGYMNLLLYGPPPEEQTGATTTSAGGLSAAARARQQRLAQWRATRQATLLQLQLLLSQVPNALLVIG